ncbi:MAG: selenocysteine-specific translation elongation factor [Myxococcota bacterium]
MAQPSLVVGTAGHIDHGKTSLVRLLTGQDLDRLPEEKERGITIALGFAPLDLPDGRRVGLVDVPGHERLVRTMIAGATGMDAVVLCVSAVDGVMPQTREHLSILELLGVRQGTVAITMADLVDDEMIELVGEDVADTVEGTFLEGVTPTVVSAKDGRGKDALIDAIAMFRSQERAIEGPFRLPVDRTFSRPGFGTVVTGTAWSGRIQEGDQVQLLPDGGQARVRSIEVHGEKVNEAMAGRRTALNLAGVDGEVARGTLVATGELPVSSILDVRYHHLSEAPELTDGASVVVLHGTTERHARLAIVDPEVEAVAPGTSLWVQLRLDRPLPCLPGDRFVLRRPSPVETLGGGHIVDPYAPRLRRKDRPVAATQLRELDQGDHEVWLDRAGDLGVAEAEWARRSDQEVGDVLGDRRVSNKVLVRLQGALLEALAAYHHEHPLSLGAHRRELRRGRLAHLPEKPFDALVMRLATEQAVMVEGALVRIAGHAVVLTDEQQAVRKKVEAKVAAAGLAGCPSAELEAALGDDVAAILRLSEADGRLREIPAIGWLAESVLSELREQIRTWFADHEDLSPGDFKELTGLTRKTAIPLLEWLDGQRITLRTPDRRMPGPAL